MASGTLQPKSGLKLVTDADSIITEEINPIIQAIETNAANNSLQVVSPDFPAQSSYTVLPAHRRVTVKNGICHVSIWITCNTNETTYATVATGLPRPDLERLQHFVPDGNAQGQPLAAYINAAQVMQVRFGAAGRTYMVEMSYPVFAG